MAVSSFMRPQTIHICTMAPGQKKEEDALRAWLIDKGYQVFARSQDPLPAKIQAARSCDLCLLLLGPDVGPQDPSSSFSHAELEASAACDDTSGRLFVLVQSKVADPTRFSDEVAAEQRDFIRRMLHFVRGSFANIYQNTDDLLALLPEMIKTRWRPPVQKARLQPQINHDAIMISSTGRMVAARQVVSKVLQQREIPVIDYKTAFSEPIAPVAWVVESARQCRAVFLILGPDYGSDIPFEGLGATELEFESALNAGKPIYAFLRSDAPTARPVSATSDPDQVQFIERVRAYLPGNHIFSFQEEGHEYPLEAQLHRALDHLEAHDDHSRSLPTIPDAQRLRWYRRRLKRWMGTIPHLTSKKAMPLEQVYVTLRALPQQPVQQQEERDERRAFTSTREKKEEEEEKKKARTFTVDEALQQFPRLILRGNPGSGKSTALHWYALTSDEQVIPIFIRLASYAQALEDGRVSSLEEFILQEERRFLLTPADRDSLWLSSLRSGQGLLLLDALDEVPRRPYHSPAGNAVLLQEQVIVDITAFAQTVDSKVRIVMTTRIAGFDPQFLETAFTITEVQPLTRSQQRQLIRHWLYTAHPDQRADVVQMAIRITDVLQRQATLNSWTRTPLMLTLLTALADAQGTAFMAETLTKATVFHRAVRLLLSQWGVLDERSEGQWEIRSEQAPDQSDTGMQRRGGQYLWNKEHLLLSLAWHNLEGGRREVMRYDEIEQVWQTLSPEVRQLLTFDAMLAELTRTDGFLIPIGEQLYTFYHPAFQEYLGAVYLASLPEPERRRLMERHRLNWQWEEVTQLLVSELDRCGRYAEADVIIEALIAADDQPLSPRPWKDPAHLALARAAQCQGARLLNLTHKPPIVAEKWSTILRQTLDDFHEQQPLREQACQAILDMGPAAVFAYPALYEMLEKHKTEVERLENQGHVGIIQSSFVPRVPAVAVEALGNFRKDDAERQWQYLLQQHTRGDETQRVLLQDVIHLGDQAEQRLRDLLLPEAGMGEEHQAAALKALIRLGPKVVSPAREVLFRFIGAQRSTKADTAPSAGELAATLVLQLAPTEEELDMIARLGSAAQQEATWRSLSLDLPLALPFLRRWLNASDVFPRSFRDRFDFTGDSYIDIRTEALEVARHLGLAAEPLLDMVLYRAIFDVERNQRIAQDIVFSFGARAIPAFDAWLARQYPNEAAREPYFQPTLQKLEHATDEESIIGGLKEGMAMIFYVEKDVIGERDKPYRDEEEAKKRAGKENQQANLHDVLQHPLAYKGGEPLFRIVGDVSRFYKAEAVEFLEELCAVALNEQLDRNARSRAIDEIEQIGPLANEQLAEKATSTLCQLVRIPEYDVDAFKALVALKQSAESALPFMLQLLEDEDWTIRAHAVEVIGWLGAKAAVALPTLRGILRDRDSQAKNQYVVRRAVVIAFGRLWPLTSPYLDDLCSALLHDPSTVVQKAAADVLGLLEIGDSAVVDALHRLMSAPSTGTEVAEAAARALAKALTRIDVSLEAPAPAAPASAQAEAPDVAKQRPPVSQPAAPARPQQSLWRVIFKMLKVIIKARVTRLFKRLLGHEAARPKGPQLSLQVRRTLIAWLLTSDEREARKYLEQHLELLQPGTESFIKVAPLVLRQFTQNAPESFAETSKVNAEILQRAISMGGTAQAVRDAYVDMFNPLDVLDTPDWIDTVHQALRRGLWLSSHYSADDAKAQGVAAMMMPLLERALARAQQADHLEPEILAILQMTQAMYLKGEDPRAVELLTHAAAVFEAQRFPHKYAGIQTLLGNAYIHTHMHNEEDDDLFRAIVCFESALSYFTPQRDFEEWAQHMIYLSQCYDLMKDFEASQRVLDEAALRLAPSSFSELEQKVHAMQRDLKEHVQNFESMMDHLTLTFSPTEMEKMRKQFDDELGDRRARLRAVRAAADRQANTR